MMTVFNMSGEPIDKIVNDTNEEIVKTIEAVLREAKAGNVSAFAYVTLDSELRVETYAHYYKGPTTLLGAISRLSQRLASHLNEDD